MASGKGRLRTAASHQATGWRLALAAVAGAVVIGAAAVPAANAKSPGALYCFHSFCHRVGTLAQTDSLVGWRGYLLASYYDRCGLDRLNPCGLTSSGAVFRPDLADNAASPLLPDGTVILAYNPRTGDASVLRVTNAGPYSGKRKLDVSRAAAEKLGFSREGVAPLVISVLKSPTKAEASYVRRRAYAPVPGYLGRFESADIALDEALARYEGRGDGDGPLGAADGTLQPVALGDALVPRPQLAVSPSLAREMTMLRSAPRPVNRGPRLVEAPRLAERPRLVEGPRLAERPRLVREAALEAERPVAPVEASWPYLFGLEAYLFPSSAADGSN